MTKPTVVLKEIKDEVDPGVLLYGCSVYVIGGDYYFNRLFASAQAKKAENIMEADLVVFTGGADVTPSKYGQVDHPKTHYNLERDEREEAIFKTCVEFGIPMVGVCRGAQFLHVMNGGKLFQHVVGHAGCFHPVITSEGEVFDVSSTHHQACKLNGHMKVLAMAKTPEGKAIATERHYGPVIQGGKYVIEKEKIEDEVEAFIYRKTLSLGVQGHPEYEGCPEFTNWFLSLICSELLDGEYVSVPKPDNHPRKGFFTRKDVV